MYDTMGIGSISVLQQVSLSYFMCCEDFSLFFLTPTPDTATSFYCYYQTPFCQCGNIIIRTENGAEDDCDLIWV